MSDLIDLFAQSAYNQELLENVHPGDYENPDPADRYNLVVIGAGTAGLVTAAGAAGLGARVALIERRFMGGDCLNYGCVPSKGIIRSARAVGELRRARELGINIQGGYEVDFQEVMDRMRKLRAQISHHDSVERFANDLGVDVFLGEAKFRDDRSIEVEGAVLNFTRAVIATGARPSTVSVTGLEEAGYFTNETLFSMKEQPERLAIIGAGPIGCEMAQTFQRLGTQVTLIEQSDQILRKEDSDATGILTESFHAEGIDIRLESQVEEVSVSNGQKNLTIANRSKIDTLTADEILVAAGREPNIESLQREKAGVESHKYGVVVNDRLQTTNKRIYAAGDVCLKYKFTHTADAAARIVIQNALFKGRSRASALTVPWCTYTDPEIAHVGIYEQEARDQGMEVEIFRRELREVDRAVLDGETDGFVKVLVEKGSDKILGATIVASDAGNMISEITTAIVGGVGLKTLSKVIHPYPTQAEAIKQTGDAYNRTRLTPVVEKLLTKWFAWTR